MTSHKPPSPVSQEPVPPPEVSHPDNPPPAPLKERLRDALETLVTTDPDAWMSPAKRRLLRPTVLWAGP
jgi:hypothetical protein